MQRSLTNDRELLGQVVWVAPFGEEIAVAREEFDEAGVQLDIGSRINPKEHSDPGVEHQQLQAAANRCFRRRGEIGASANQVAR